MHLRRKARQERNPDANDDGSPSLQTALPERPIRARAAKPGGVDMMEAGAPSMIRLLIGL